VSQQPDYRSALRRPATMRSRRFVPVLIRLGAIILIGGLLAWAMDAHWMNHRISQGLAQEIQGLKGAMPELRGRI
jgi:hypothetical protein